MANGMSAVQILEAFGKVKAIIQTIEKAKGKNKEVSPEEQQWINEMNSLMITLRDEFLCETSLPVRDLCEIFGMTNQRIYQIRGKQKKAA
jgi:hypothetical protein